jgi:hypothetical protein
MLVDGGLPKAGQKPNPLASDEQFVRRVYLDIAGRIPTREEALEFINDTSVSKRAKVIDKLLNSDGYRSHLFNYLADMLRVADVAQKARYYTYQDWLKSQIADNVPWNQDGPRDDGGRWQAARPTEPPVTCSAMRACGSTISPSRSAPSSARMFPAPSATTIPSPIGRSGSFTRWRPSSVPPRRRHAWQCGYNGRDAPGTRLLDDKRLQQQAKNILRVNAMAVADGTENDLKLPDDYKYDDGKPGDPVKPKLVTWADDKTKKAYHGTCRRRTRKTCARSSPSG